MILRPGQQFYLSSAELAIEISKVDKAEITFRMGSAMLVDKKVKFSSVPDDVMEMRMAFSEFIKYYAFEDMLFNNPDYDWNEEHMSKEERNGYLHPDIELPSAA